MAEFVGKYKYDKDDGKFDDFLKALDVNFMTRKIAGTTKPTVEIIRADDGTMHFKTSSTFKNSEVVFKMGEEVVEKRMDGVDCKTVFTQEGNKLVQKQGGEPPCEIVREFTGDKMIVTCVCKDVTTVREYKKVTE